MIISGEAEKILSALMSRSPVPLGLLGIHSSVFISLLPLCYFDMSSILGKEKKISDK